MIIAETERLILRRYKKEDLQDLFEYVSDEQVVAFEPYKAMSLGEAEENLAWRIGTDEMIAVELRDGRKMIGNVYMGKREFDALEIGFVFNRNYWGNGYALESCEALLRQAFSRGIHRFYGECDPENIRSWKLLAFAERHICCKTFGSGRMKAGSLFGRIPTYMQNSPQKNKHLPPDAGHLAPGGFSTPCRPGMLT